MPYLEVKGSRFHYEIDDYSDPWKRRSTVMLLHAAAGNVNRWRAWVPTLSRYHRVVRFDARGHGDTPAPPGLRFSLPGLAADLVGIMDALEIDRVHLVGASGGGIVSLRFAHDFPERLHSLTLVASTPRLAQTRLDTSAWSNVLESKGTKAWLLSEAAKRFGPNTESGVMEWYAEEGGRTSAEVVIALQQCLMAQDLTALLPEIQAPTLILAARNDEITPMEIQRLMARRIPRATLRTYAGVGHNMKHEIPDRLARQVLRFIRQVEG